MPPSRTVPSFILRRTSQDPYQNVQVRKDPKGVLMYSLEDCAHHIRDARDVGVTHDCEKFYAHLRQPEYSQPLPQNLIPHDPRPPPLELADLKALRTLGCGVSGSVLYAKTMRNAHKLDRPGTVFAVKVIEKKYQHEFDTPPVDGLEPEKKHLERSLLTELPWNPFVCGLVGTFIDDLNIYHAFEFCPRNSLRHLLLERLEPHVARFFFCGIVAGLAFIHDNNILHRDLKPENVFLGPGGYPVIGDFGEARRMQHDYPILEEGEGGFRLAPALASFDWREVGTSMYNAPEQYTSKTKDTFLGPSIDWYAAGIILYEMLTRKYPFYSTNEMRMAAMMKRGRIRWPTDLRVGKTTRALVSALLAADPLKRLGTFGVQEIMDHAWFGGIDWAKVHARQYLSPHKNTYLGPGERWHTLPLPKQENVPGLPVAVPPPELRHDARFKLKTL
ncbi:hypothetical protein D9757_007248 [Collybiopsis confluens]|uniref:cAMP-dependent protein kinase n=1 Tax=Collybiopsis confluens TaxID=2823264 RepID=A0A8H5HAW8_9AGAR|nr:hypothetical protein D9757_007248 [Collybiopsis confluens]